MPLSLPCWVGNFGCGKVVYIGIHAVITSDDRSCIQQPEIFVCYRVSLPGHLALSSRQDPNIRAIG